jgi:hypothetical protein
MQGELNTSIGAINTDIAGVNANVTLASEWAIKNDAAVSGTDWSAFANASGASPTGSAKAWATTAQDTPVSGGEYSAKHYSTEASDSATAAASSATAAANTANAAMWVSGQAYAEGDNAISGVNYKTYRATTATSGTTDPSASGDWNSLAYNLPSQSGNSGKFLTTNGTDESWGDAGGGGATAQVVYAETTAAASGTTTIPGDDTIPQNTEGTQFLTASITPTDASNYLLIEAAFQVSNISSGQRLAMALFVDSTADAIATVFNRTTNGYYPTGPVVLRKRIAAGSTSARTYKIRIGATSGSIEVNQWNGTQNFGGTEVSSITISEVTP